MDFNKWHREIGSIWARLLDAHTLNCEGTIVEIGPGYTDKIGQGLVELGFSGRLYIVEPNQSANNWIISHYRTLLPAAEVISIDQPTWLAGEWLPDEVEAVLMNHVLDDMTLHAALLPEQRESVFGNMQPAATFSPMVRQSWEKLLTDSDKLKQTEQRVINDILHLLSHTQPRLFATSQYPSWVLEDQNLQAVNILGIRLLQQLRKELGDISIEDQQLIESLKQQPEHWLLVKYKNKDGQDSSVKNRITQLNQH